jgi:hypothetical protein
MSWRSDRDFWLQRTGWSAARANEPPCSGHSHSSRSAASLLPTWVHRLLPPEQPAVAESIASKAFMLLSVGGVVGYVGVIGITEPLTRRWAHAVIDPGSASVVLCVFTGISTIAELLWFVAVAIAVTVADVKQPHPRSDSLIRPPGDTLPAMSARSVQSYIPRALGDCLAEAQSAMERLAASLPPEELNRVRFRLHERFRPDVPEGAQGWGAKGASRVERIVGAAR